MSAVPVVSPVMDQYHLLPRITFRQLEVLRAVYRERSFANAALDLHSTRGNIKRMCAELEQILGGVLFENQDAGTLNPTPFAHAMVTQMGPLARSVRRLEDAVATMHETGRVLRLAATPELFESGWFTGFLRRFRTHGSFRVCCLMQDDRRFRTALLNAECDVFLGCGMTPSDKLDIVDLGAGTMADHRQQRDGASRPAKSPEPPCLEGGGQWRPGSHGSSAG
ncbi:MAG: LysR family transcriptional regulator [Luteolibacter sp.]